MRPDCQIPGLEHIYNGFFKGRKGFFLEIGGHDGVSYSNTCDLAKSGWKGMYVEPIQDLAHQCRINHANNDVKILNCAVSNANGELTLYHGPDIQTANKEFANSEDFSTVPCYTLNHLISCYELPPIDLLVIDVEFHEKEVLSGFDLKKHKPKMVIIEAHEYHVDKKMSLNAEFINQFFKDYTRIYSDGINNIYVHD